MLNCVMCGHPCHCKGVGTYVNTNQCMVLNCNCINCIHATIGGTGGVTITFT